MIRSLQFLRFFQLSMWIPAEKNTDSKFNKAEDSIIALVTRGVMLWASKTEELMSCTKLEANFGLEGTEEAA